MYIYAVLDTEEMISSTSSHNLTPTNNLIFTLSSFRNLNVFFLQNESNEGHELAT